jgi:succinate dehydrogenase / fumarate reductase, cytochrome b subunit
LHLTAGLVDPSVHNRLDAGGHVDVYGKVVNAFQNPLYVMLYLVGQLALGVHLSHAVSSSLQTLGIEHAAFNRLFKKAGPAVALFVVLGNLAIIFAIFLGIVRA